MSKSDQIRTIPARLRYGPRTDPYAAFERLAEAIDMTTSPQLPSETTERFFDGIDRADTALLQTLVAEGSDIAAAEAEYGEGALDYAIRVHFDSDSDPRPVLQLLLELGADINARVDGFSALVTAVWHCDVEVAEWLILHGAEVNTIYPDFHDTVLDIAELDQLIARDSRRREPEEYQPLIDMLLRHGAKRADDLINSLR